MSIGRRIRTLRKAMSLTQQKLADSVSVSRIYIQALESNRRLPSMKLLQKLGPALGVDVTDILGDVSGRTGRVQLEEVLDSSEIEVWYKNKRLSWKNLQLVHRIIKAVLDDEVERSVDDRLA